MEQKIITSERASELNAKILQLISEGWKPVGGHHVVTTFIQNTIRGDSVIVTSNYRSEYSQTMKKD